MEVEIHKDISSERLPLFGFAFYGTIHQGPLQLQSLQTLRKNALA